MDHAITSHAPRSPRRTVALRALGLAAVVTLVAACSDTGPTAPLAAGTPSAGPSLSKKGSTTSAAPTTQTFVYSGQELKVSFGDGHELKMDSASVCDPATSGYGPGMWDRPCAPATSPITFTVTSWRDADGRPQVTFSPDVRFVPGTTETLYLNDNPGQAKKATIRWCAASGVCVDESLTDPTLTTKISAGRVARRIKHFSGYNVVFGFGDSEGGL